MRTAAQVTGGRYLFLTDDSGIGGAHQEPTIPCYFVTALSRAMIRMAAMELSGTNVAVAPRRCHPDGRQSRRWPLLAGQRLAARAALGR
jgi:hypothetical protein